MVKRADALLLVKCIKKINTISTTIINIHLQPKDSCLLSIKGLNDQHSHTHTNKQTDYHPLPEQITGVKDIDSNSRMSHLAASEEWGGGCWGVEGRTKQEGRKVFRQGRGLGTSFNSTLLWKLQLPLSRLAPWPHRAASVCCTITPIDHHPWEKKPRWAQGWASCFWGTFQTCVWVCMCVWSAKPLTCHTFGEHKNERPDLDIFLSLHNHDYAKVYWEAEQARGEGDGGGQCWVGGVELRGKGRER